MSELSKRVLLGEQYRLDQSGLFDKLEMYDRRSTQAKSQIESLQKQATETKFAVSQCLNKDDLQDVHA